MTRYARQAAFSYIGEEGQKKLLHSKVAIIGMGALGTVSANNLCRSGVGYIRIIDRDYVDITNLQRQILYNEDDAMQNLPKAVAAFTHLSKVNSEITIEPIVSDVNSSNITRLINDVDLVLDATDNLEIRLLINEACHALKIPWIYCAALGSKGMTMNILPYEDAPCLTCFVSESDFIPMQSCSTFGVLNMITNAIASIQTVEAIKILTNADSVRKELLMIDIWNTHFVSLKINKNTDCKVCSQGKYDYFGKTLGSYTTELCGSNSIQVVPSRLVKMDFDVLAGKLESAGRVSFNPFTFNFSDGKHEITLFRDGRAIIKNAIDSNQAKSVYSEYIGL